MNFLKRCYNAMCALLLPVLLLAQDSELARNFKKPPAEYSLLPFWSWNGTLQADKLIWQMDQMQEKGIHGAFLHARAGLDESATPYFSEGFWNAVDTTIKHAASIGFQTCLYDEDKWPSGSAGGRTVAANPEEFVKKMLVYSKMEVVGPQTIRINLQKNPISVFAGRISENGKYDLASQVNLSHQIGREWQVPDGRWGILSFTMAQDPEKQIDYLDSLAVAKFIDLTHAEYFKRYSKYFGNTIPGIFFDEIYANGSSMAGNMFWTDDFIQQFKRIKGYDLSERLPLLMFDDPETSAKIRCDYFDVVKELYIRAWFKPYADWCAKHSIWATGHTTEKPVHYKRQADYFSTMGQLQVPGADNEEYRYGYPRMIDWFNNKQISSIANLYNRKRVMSETMGGGGYAISLEEYRYGISMLAIYGINLFIPHLFHYTTETPETQADWPPSWFFNNPFWKYFKPLAEFGNRISYMNSQGHEVCEVAILYPLTDLWVGGYSEQVDDTFYKQVQQVLLDHHINFNIIDPASMAKAKIVDRTLQAGSGRYRLLILPDIHAIRLDVLEQIETFVNSGGIVVALKSLPAGSERGQEGDAVVAGKIKQLFGILPAELRPNEYYQWNLAQTEHYVAKAAAQGGVAYFSRFINQLADIINRSLIPDLQVDSENSQYLQFNHRQIADTHVFQLVNDRNLAQSYFISIKEIGTPSLWNPETGDIRPVDSYRIRENRMDFVLDFQARECLYLVIEPRKPDPSHLLLESTDLVDCRITKRSGSIIIEGWGKTNQTHHITGAVKEQTINKVWSGKQTCPDLSLSGSWQFQLAPHALDYQWRSRVDVDTLHIPVMKFQPERMVNEGTKRKWSAPDCDDSAWKTIKVTDLYNKNFGIQRYTSGWDSWWISYYDNSTHLPAIVGGDRVFKKEIVLESPVKAAKLAITADQTYELWINEKPVGKGQDWKIAELYDISGWFRPGANTLQVKTTNTKGLLLQGFVHLKNGKTIAIRSDSTWQIAAGQINERPAFQFAAPPQGHWGDIANPLQNVQYPLVVWYRQHIPPGITALIKPAVKGSYTLFINGAAVQMEKSADAVDIRKMLRKGMNTLALRVEATDPTCGLIQPLTMLCRKTELPLTAWHDLGLGWYSGRAVYSKTVKIPSACLNDETRLLLDLGQVNYFAEIWVNGKLVSYRPWPPFEAEITGFVHPGENEITIVVANLLANQAGWNILDANISSKEARWWHDGSLMREKNRLVSGLLGPVRIIPLHKESIEMTRE